MKRLSGGRGSGDKMPRKPLTAEVTPFNKASAGPRGRGSTMKGGQSKMGSAQVTSESTTALLRELVAHLRQNRTQLREEWARRITEAKLLTAMTKEEVFAEATSVYDNYVEALETGSVEALQAYARNLSERIIPRGVETHEVVGI